MNESGVSETFQSNISCVAVVIDADASVDAESLVLIVKQTYDTIISVIVYTRHMWQNVEKLSWHVSLIEQNEIYTLNMQWFWLLFISLTLEAARTAHTTDTTRSL